jgi:hypothetical protein
MGANAQFYRPVRVDKIWPRHPAPGRRRKQHLTTETVFLSPLTGGPFKYSISRPQWVAQTLAGSNSRRADLGTATLCSDRRTFVAMQARRAWFSVR